MLQFKFVDPIVVEFATEVKPHENLHLDKDNIIFSQVVCRPFLQIPVTVQLAIPFIELKSAYKVHLGGCVCKEGLQLAIT